MIWDGSGEAQTFKGKDLRTKERTKRRRKERRDGEEEGEEGEKKERKERRKKSHTLVSESAHNAPHT